MILAPWAIDPRTWMDCHAVRTKNGWDPAGDESILLMRTCRGVSVAARTATERVRRGRAASGRRPATRLVEGRRQMGA